MYRVAIAVVYALLTFGGGAIMNQGVEANEEEVRSRLIREVGMSHRAHEELVSLRYFRLSEVAEDLAESRIAAYMSTLEAFRGEMLRVESDVYQRFPGEVEDEVLKAKRAEHVAANGEFLGRFADALAGSITALEGPGAMIGETREGFMSDTQEALTVCNAYAVNTCFFRMTWFPLKERVDELRNTKSHGISPDLVVVVDSRGTGLADADRRKWSDDSQFGERHPFIGAARGGETQRDVISIDNRFYYAVATPIFDGDAFRGVILVGMEIDDALLAEETRILGYKLSYLHGANLVRSSLDAPLRRQLEGSIPARTRANELRSFISESLVMHVIAVGQGARTHGIRAVISANLDEALAPIRLMRTTVWLYGGLMFLVGLGLIFWAMRSALAPLVTLDSGVHELIGGNNDYEFPFDFRNKLWSSFAQSLNLMVGLHLGRDMEEMPDEGTWEGELLKDTSPPDEA